MSYKWYTDKPFKSMNFDDRLDQLGNENIDLLLQVENDGNDVFFLIEHLSQEYKRILEDC